MILYTLPIVLALAAYANAACSDIAHCDSCVNPPLQCYTCSAKQILKQDKTGCLDCPTNCATCVSDAADEVKCSTCDTGYVLEKDGTCTECPTGCLSCFYDSSTDPELICDACKIHYVMDETSETKDCVECPSNCKTCSLDDEGETVCSACYTKEEHGSRAYYLRGSDKSCRSCPSNCDACADNGNGAGICKACKSGYVPLVNEDEPTKDGTKCLKCPTDCTACSGIQNGAVATCTSCKKDEGLWVDNGECSYCGGDASEEDAKTCDEEGTPTECHKGWRLDTGSCVKCPAFCLTCSIDDSTGEDVCDSCSNGYGTKAVTSITCDACPSNCAYCTSNSEGVLSCSTCKSGYAKNGDGKCVSCASGCATCHWVTADSYMSCDTCKTGYSNTPITPDGGAETSSNIAACEACPSHCNDCTNGDSCSAGSANCDDGYVIVVDSNSDNKCEAVESYCTTAEDDGTTDCNVCDDGYYEDSGACSACPSTLLCKTCDVVGNDACDSCPEGYAFVDTDADNSTDACESCGISKCTNCHAIGDEAGATKKCFTCETGYALYDTDSNTGNGYEQCKRCPSGCDTCTINTSDNDKTKCSNGGCSAWDNKKAYTNGDDGACVVCPSNCMACTYDISEEQTICTSGQCATGFTKNEDSGECEECPTNCATCEWDSSASAVICSSGGCDTGYGLTLDSECEACPNNCDSCTYDETLETLICDTCSSGYRSNDNVCGACPSNCATCSDTDGSMKCSACKTGYALRSSDKVCVKCPSHCEECVAKSTTVECKTCKTGYGISGDKLACVACRDAAFDNCATCTSVNATTETAVCQSCTLGYVLKDDASTCLDTSSLDCPIGAEDRGAECSSCNPTHVLLSDKSACTQYCYSCGDIGASIFVEQSLCLTGAKGKVEQCGAGACFGKYKVVDGKKMVASGCMASTVEKCEGKVENGEVCKATGTQEECRRCCKGDKCNAFVSELDGIPDSAGVPNISAFFLVMSIVLARVM